MQTEDYLSKPAMARRRGWPATDKADLPVFSDEHLQEGRLLLNLGFGKPVIARMMLRARDSGASVETELLVSGEVAEELYFEALARHLGLPFLPDIDADRVHDVDGLDLQLRLPEMLRLFLPDRSAVTVIVPTLDRLEAISKALERQRGVAQIMAVTTPKAMRSAVWRCGQQRRLRQTRSFLSDAAPLHSARVVLWGGQGFAAGLSLSALAASALVSPLLWLMAMHVFMTLLFFSQLVLRFRAMAYQRQAPRLASPERPVLPRAEPVPVYSVFVALYREKDVVAQLVSALDRLDWPRSRLDIKLICEEDDMETLHALMALPLGGQYEIVRVPAASPRTKPKALSYALPGARGTYLTIYDAEDRPHPGQLREAHAAFLTADPAVACLQAPLIVTNAAQGWLASMFALEYAGLFRGLLPFLSAAGLPLPLGGTSNHFRTAALKEVGGWDPYNTTEDADLGMRLHRLGYKAQMIRCPTLEDAPTEWRNWFGQRTRWYKGWLQTWLVVMRDPLLLWRQMGWKAFLTFQTLIGGMILSALTHPLTYVFLLALGWMLTTGRLSSGQTHLAETLTVLDSVNILGSYIVLVQLGRRSMPSPERKAIGWRWLTIPVYCLVISGAAWTALIELYRKPFSWNKTRHTPCCDADHGQPFAWRLNRASDGGS